MQKVVCKSNQTITERGLIISVENTKLMAFKRREPVGNKIVIDDKIYIRNTFVEILRKFYIL
jgi:hypothetical protein